MEPVLENTIEGFSGILLVSENPGRLAAFYRDALEIPLEDEHHEGTLPHWGATLGETHFAIHPIEDFPDRSSGVGAVKLAFAVFDVRGFTARLEAKGVKFHLGNTIKAIEGRVVVLSDDTTIEGDLIVIGVGVTPRIALAEAAGLTIDNGIVVDESLKTSADGIWAAGDVAHYPDPRVGNRIRIEHWVVAERQGQAAARSMLGVGKPYNDVPFGSMHSGGMNGAFGDGSVRFLRQSLDMATYRAIASRNGGETLALND